MGSGNSIEDGLQRPAGRHFGFSREAGLGNPLQGQQEPTVFKEPLGPFLRHGILIEAWSSETKGG